MRLMLLVVPLFLAMSFASAPASGSAGGSLLVSPPQPQPLLTWSQVTANGGGLTTQVLLGQNNLGNHLWTWSVGLRIPGGNVDQQIFWDVITYPSPSDMEDMHVYHWYSGEAYWINLEFITPDYAQSVYLEIINYGPTRVFEYSSFDAVNLNWANIEVYRGQTTVQSTGVYLLAYSGLKWVYSIENLAADALYIFQVELWNWGLDDWQQVAWMLRCYRSANDDPAGPTGIAATSRHLEYFGRDHQSVINLLVPTRAAGAYCRIFVNNWDPNPNNFHIDIRFYRALNTIHRALASNGESPLSWVYLGPGGFAQVTLVATLPPGFHYLGWSRVLLRDAQTENDFDQKAAWYIAIAYPPPDDYGTRAGYQLRQWTNFGQGYPHPWAEGTTYNFLPYDANSLILYIKNTDANSHYFGYAFWAFSWTIDHYPP